MSNIGKAIRKANNTPFIKYYPELGKAFNSICAAVLLKQIDYLFEANNNEPFYKFKEPCGHSLYQVGRSWTEELGVNRGEFEGALSRLGAVKVTKGVKLNEVKLTSLIVYYTDKDRVTWYWLNLEMYEQILETAFTIKSGNEDLLCKAENSLYIEKRKTDFTLPIKELKKDKEEEEDKKPKKAKVVKRAKPANEPAKDTTTTHDLDRSVMNVKSELLWQMDYTNNTELNAKLTDWAFNEVINQLPAICTKHGKSYSSEQLQAWATQQLKTDKVNVCKTQFSMFGEPLHSDTVKHIVNRANWQLTNKGGLYVPQAGVKAKKVVNNYSSPF